MGAFRNGLLGIIFDFFPRLLKQILVYSGGCVRIRTVLLVSIGHKFSVCHQDRPGQLGASLNSESLDDTRSHREPPPKSISFANHQRGCQSHEIPAEHHRDSILAASDLRRSHWKPCVGVVEVALPDLCQVLRIFSGHLLSEVGILRLSLAFLLVYLSFFKRCFFGIRGKRERERYIYIYV